MSARRVAVVLSALALAVTGIPVGVPALVGTSVPRAAAEDDPGASVFLNEIHYANSGVDTGEFVEIAGPSGAELEGFQILLYSGETGEPYDSQTLTGSIPLNGVAVVDYPVEGVQDGPDAVALVDSAVVSQFLSYGGEVTATDGPAAGLTSTALGLAESEETPPESSLQVTGMGGKSGDFGGRTDGQLARCTERRADADVRDGGRRHSAADDRGRRGGAWRDRRSDGPGQRSGAEQRSRASPSWTPM